MCYNSNMKGLVSLSIAEIMLSLIEMFAIRSRNAKREAVITFMNLRHRNLDRPIRSYDECYSTSQHSKEPWC